MSKREEIKEHTTKFVDGLMKLLRAQAHETVDASFVDGEEPEAPSTPERASKRPKRAKRAPRETPTASTESLQKPILAFVRSNPHCDGRAIANSVSKTPTQIRPLLNDLVTVGQLKRTGMGRGVRYSMR